MRKARLERGRGEVSRRYREAVRLSVIGVLCIAVIAGMKAAEWGERRAFGANQIMGITLVEDESVLEDKEKLPWGQNPGVCYEEVPLPFDQEGVLYLAQSPEEEWTGRLSAAAKSYRLYAPQDGYWEHKQDAIRESHGFVLWLVGEECYYEMELVVSGMPVVSIQTSRGEEAGRDLEPGEIEDPDIGYFEPDVVYYGTIDVFNPGVNTGKYEILQSHVRYHHKGATSLVFDKKSYSLSLQDYREQNIDVSLLGMRRDNKWKLNAMFNDPNRIREMTASQIWEEFDAAYLSVNEAGLRMEYVELILDGQYQGIYGLMEPIDEKKLDLDRNDVLYKVCDWMVPTDEEIMVSVEMQWKLQYPIRIRYPDTISDFAMAWSYVRDYLDTFYRGQELSYEEFAARVDLGNIADKQMFVMVTSAEDNFFKNTYLVARVDAQGEYVMYQVPWDLDMTFGSKFDGYQPNFRGVEPDHTVEYREQVMDALLEVAPEEAGAFLMDRWGRYRESFLATEHILKLMTDNRDYLVATGAALREQERWPDEEISMDIEELLDYQTRRMEWLDGYFGR